MRKIHARAVYVALELSPFVFSLRGSEKISDRGFIGENRDRDQISFERGFVEDVVITDNRVIKVNADVSDCHERLMSIRGRST